MQAYKKKGFWVGLLLFIICNLLPPPPGLSESGWVVASRSEEHTSELQSHS